MEKKYLIGAGVFVLVGIVLFTIFATVGLLSFSGPDFRSKARCEDCVDLTWKKYVGQDIVGIERMDRNLYSSPNQDCNYEFASQSYDELRNRVWEFETYCGNLPDNICPDMPASVVDDNTFRSWLAVLEADGVDVRANAYYFDLGTEYAYASNWKERDLVKERPIQHPDCRAVFEARNQYLVDNGLIDSTTTEPEIVEVIKETTLYVCPDGSVTGDGDSCEDAVRYVIVKENVVKQFFVDLWDKIAFWRADA